MTFAAAAMQGVALGVYAVPLTCLELPTVGEAFAAITEETLRAGLVTPSAVTPVGLIVGALLPAGIETETTFTLAANAELHHFVASRYAGRNTPVRLAHPVLSAVDATASAILIVGDEIDAIILANSEALAAHILAGLRCLGEAVLLDAGRIQR